MRSIRKKTELLLALLAMGCNEPVAAPLPHAGSETPTRGGELHLASFADIKSLDPAVAADTLTGEAIELLFAGLVDFDDNGRIVPDLAERYERSDDGLVYRFFLREGLQFHDGTPITAKECARSIERALHPDTPSSFATYYDHIEGFEEFNTKKTSEHLRGVVVEGERVLAIHLKEPDAAFLSIFAMQALRPVCPSAGDKYDDTWQPCGAGPFKLESWDRGRSVRLVRFDGWYEPGKPFMDAITFTYTMGVVTQRFKFEQGDLDIARELMLADTFRYQSDPRWKPLGGYDHIPSIGAEEMNVEMPPFDNVEVRRAVAAAIDREQFRMVKTSALEVLTRVLVPVLGGDDPAFVGQKYDYAAALEHMRRAGFPFDPKTGVGGWPKTITYPIYKQGLFESTAQIIQQQLAKIGIRIELKIVSYPTYLAMTKRRGTVALAPAAWSQDFPDPSDFFDPIFATNQINDEDSNNGSFYSNPKLDDLLVRGRRELDPAARKRIYDEADAIVCDEAPWAMEYQYKFYGVHQPYVKGLRWSAVWPNYVRDVWLDKPKKVAARRPDALDVGALEMMKRAFRRLAWALLVVWATTTVTFFINNVLPSDPARMVAGPQARPKDVERVRQQLGLDRPVLEQYARFMKRLVHFGPSHFENKDPEHGTCANVWRVHFDLGKSYQQRRPVTTILGERLPRTLMLAIAAVLIQTFLGVVTGLIAAVKRNTAIDHLTVGSSLVGISAPTFLIGLALQFVLAHRLRLLPLDGFGDTPIEHLVCIILPALTLGIYGAAYYTRVVRDELIGAVKLDHVRTARAKGLPMWRVWIRHALRNALVPLVTLIGLDLGALVGGAIVTETLFRWPGLGALSVSALLDRDGPVIMGTVIVSSAAIVLANLVVDVSYAVLDPRVRR